MKLDLKLEDGRIGEHPEVIYHVFHTLLFGGLALLFDGYRHTCNFIYRNLKTSNSHKVHFLKKIQLSFFFFMLWFFSRSRMKYLWTPYVCMFTAFGVCSPDLWMTVFKWLKLKSIHPVVLVSNPFLANSNTCGTLAKNISESFEMTQISASIFGKTVYIDILLLVCV